MLVLRSYIRRANVFEGECGASTAGVVQAQTVDFAGLQTALRAGFRIPGREFHGGLVPVNEAEGARGLWV